ncbi:MAG TPA: hypothetical protein VFH42_07250 [Sporolactobacillaceae bacterium]|nr:hypothetical protein [Sporolactobacillaceae bacterium]
MGGLATNLLCFDLVYGHGFRYFSLKHGFFKFRGHPFRYLLQIRRFHAVLGRLTDPMSATLPNQAFFH